MKHIWQHPTDPLKGKRMFRSLGELESTPSFVAKLVGHNIRTMEKHYENIQLLNLEPELVKVTRDNLEENDFQTFDIDML